MTKDDDPSVAVPALLERARKLGPRLGDAADQLNASLETAEKNLAGLKLGVNASVLLSSNEHGFEEWLAFEKHGNAWRLVLESGDAAHDHWTESLLVNASRGTRREAVGRLPDLLAALIAKAEAEILEVEEAAREVDRFSAAVRSAREKGGK
jgi:hypothetical protein